MLLRPLSVSDGQCFSAFSLSLSACLSQSLCLYVPVFPFSVFLYTSVSVYLSVSLSLSLQLDLFICLYYFVLPLLSVFSVVNIRLLLSTVSARFFFNSFSPFVSFFLFFVFSSTFVCLPVSISACSEWAT